MLLKILYLLTCQALGLVRMVFRGDLAKDAELLARTRRPGAALCLAVVAGGAAGNLADRLLLRSPGRAGGR